MSLRSVVVMLAALGFFGWEVVGLVRWRPMARWIFSGCLKFWSVMLFSQTAVALLGRSWSATGVLATIGLLGVNGIVNSMLHSEPHARPSRFGETSPYLSVVRHR